MMRIVNLIPFFIVLIILYVVLASPSLFYINIVDTLELWLYKVLPPIATFYIVTAVLICFGYLQKVCFIFNPLNKIIGFEQQQSFHLFIIGCFIGNPSGCVFYRDYYESGIINKNDYYVLCLCGSFVTPLFIFSFFEQLNVALIIYISHIIANIVIGCFLIRKKSTSKPSPKDDAFRNNFLDNNKETSFREMNFREKSFREMNFRERSFREKNFLSYITNLANILQIIATMMVLMSIIKYSLAKVIDNNSLISSFLLSTLELATGLNDIWMTDAPTNLKTAMGSFLVGFGGFAIHLQVASVTTCFKYWPFFIVRIIQGVLTYFFSSLLLFVFTSF